MSTLMMITSDRGCPKKMKSRSAKIISQPYTLSILTITTVVIFHLMPSRKSCHRNLSNVSNQDHILAFVKCMPSATSLTVDCGLSIHSSEVPQFESTWTAGCHRLADLPLEICPCLFRFRPWPLCSHPRKTRTSRSVIGESTISLCVCRNGQCVVNLACVFYFDIHMTK